MIIVKFFAIVIGLYTTDMALDGYRLENPIAMVVGSITAYACFLILVLW